VEKFCLITGKIAHKAVCRVAEKIKDKNVEIISLKCTVAALMTTDFIAKELVNNAALSGTETIIIPGLCQGSLQPIIEVTGCEVLRGPKDLADLPAMFQAQPDLWSDNQETIYQNECSPIKIVAEIVDAPRMSLKQIMAKASYYRENGADIIDLGGDVNQPFPNLRQVIHSLKKEGYKVSIDSHQREDILEANKAGVDLVLSFNSFNLETAKGLDCPVVVIPDNGEDLDSLYRNMELLDKWNIPYLVDPILPPLTMGLAEGIGRYLKVRQDFPNCELFMGLGNVTELVDADSIGLNALLVGIAGELRINYLLTTEVSYRAQGCIKEISFARDLIQRALEANSLPKHLNYGLLTIKDPTGNSFAREELMEMQEVIKDNNYRIFVADYIYIFNSSSFWLGKSAQELFPKLDVKDSKHAFYLGRELEKAETALCLRKKYIQDTPLRWGYYNEKKR